MRGVVISIILKFFMVMKNILKKMMDNAFLVSLYTLFN